MSTSDLLIRKLRLRCSSSAADADTRRRLLRSISDHCSDLFNSVAAPDRLNQLLSVGSFALTVTADEWSFDAVNSAIRLELQSALADACARSHVTADVPGTSPPFSPSRPQHDHSALVSQLTQAAVAWNPERAKLFSALLLEQPAEVIASLQTLWQRDNTDRSERFYSALQLWSLASRQYLSAWLEQQVSVPVQNLISAFAAYRSNPAAVVTGVSLAEDGLLAVIAAYAMAADIRGHVNTATVAADLQAFNVAPQVSQLVSEVLRGAVQRGSPNIPLSSTAVTAPPRSDPSAAGGGLSTAATPEIFKRTERSSPEIVPTVPVRQGHAQPEILVSDAGLVLLHPWIPELLRRAGIAGAACRDDAHAFWQATAILQFAVTGTQSASVGVFPGVSRILLGRGLSEPALFFPAELSEELRCEVRALLESVVQHWQALGRTTLTGLQQTFLQRKGILTESDTEYRLRLETRGVDVLLQRLPWSISCIRLPWMPKPLFVDWNEP